jgi:hypothetical protein
MTHGDVPVGEQPSSRLSWLIWSPQAPVDLVERREVASSSAPERSQAWPRESPGTAAPRRAEELADFRAALEMDEQQVPDRNVRRTAPCQQSRGRETLLRASEHGLLRKDSGTVEHPVTVRCETLPLRSRRAVSRGLGRRPESSARRRTSSLISVPGGCLDFAPSRALRASV